MRKIAILQPNYIPWKGVFDLANRSDVFVFYDDVVYTKRDWRNRNKIKSANGEIWLTVPVLTKGRHGQLICEAQINNTINWQDKHFRSLWTSYRKTRFFSKYEYILEAMYKTSTWEYIADLNIFSTKLIASALGIDVEWYTSSDIMQKGDKNGERAINICKALNAQHFINGPSSKRFLDESLFPKNEIVLEYIEYEYPTYSQLHGSFCHHVSVLDVLFHCGPDAPNVIFK